LNSYNVQERARRFAPVGFRTYNFLMTLAGRWAVVIESC
jgi:hypothetical protein